MARCLIENVHAISAAAELSHFAQGNGPTRDDVFAANHVTQRFASLNQPVDADGMVGHLVVDVRIESRRGGARREQLRLVEFEEGQSHLEEERASAAAAGGKIFSAWYSLVRAILHGRSRMSGRRTIWYSAGDV